MLKEKLIIAYLIFKAQKVAGSTHLCKILDFKTWD